MATKQPIALSQAQASMFEPEAKMMAANGIAQSLSFTSERKYLNGISSATTATHREHLTA